MSEQDHFHNRDNGKRTRLIKHAVLLASFISFIHKMYDQTKHL